MSDSIETAISTAITGTIATSLDHKKNKFGRIKNKNLPSLPTGQLAWKEREKRGKGLPVAVCMALIVPFNVVSIF